MEMSSQLHASCHFTLVERTPGTRCIGGWMCPRGGVGATHADSLVTVLIEQSPLLPNLTSVRPVAAVKY
jgi:hypothetical protein